MDNKGYNCNRTKIIHRWVGSVCACILLGGMAAYGDENLEELKKSLLEQERQMERSQREVETGNRGYIYGSNVEEPGVEEVAEAEKPVPAVKPKAVQTTASATRQKTERDLCRQAWSLYEEGYLDEAGQKAEEVLALNPLHIPMKRLIKMITDKKARYAREDNTITDKERMLAVDRAWLPPKEEKERKDIAEERPAARTRQKLIMEEQLGSNTGDKFYRRHIRCP